MSKLPISVFIICKDEADRIAATINSVREWVEEVVVVDSGSTDETVEIAKKLGADKLLFNEWRGYGEQKIFAEQQCKHDWILNLDADEEISPSLRDEILAEFTNATPAKNNAYRLRCVIMTMQQKKPSPFAYVNAPIRLYNRQTASFSSSTVHDSVIAKEKLNVKKLAGDVFHRSFRSEEHMVAKLNNYSTMQAAEMFAKGRKVGVARCVFEPYTMFFKSYILRKNFAYGFAGFALSRNYAHYRFLRLAKLRELWALQKFDSNKETS